MKLVQRLERLEAASTEAFYRQWADRLSEKWGIPAERLFHKFLEIGDRIERWGLDEELRRLAGRCDWTEEEAREHFEKALASLPKEETNEVSGSPGTSGAEPRPACSHRGLVRLVLAAVAAVCKAASARRRAGGAGA